MAATLDPIALTQELIRYPSVTPEEAGALDYLESVLTDQGFTCERMLFSEAGTADVDNLYARRGTGPSNFCFAGHIDVVPVGNEANWSVAPFEGIVEGGQVLGRGACDMKGAIAAFVSAVSRMAPAKSGSICLLITGDEEGPAINGTIKMLEALRARGEHFDHCLVGEPSCQRALGDMVKIGRRGSFNARLIARGAQGHVAYPHLADNPIPRLLALLGRLQALRLDEGTEHFQPSNLEIVTVDTGNAATNVIPAEVTAGFNIRFNNLHTEASLLSLIEAEIAVVEEELGGTIELHAKASGEAFLTEPCDFTDLVCAAIEEQTGLSPTLSTGGGTSDARFIAPFAPVLEFGLVGQTMHKADEHAAVSDIEGLAEIYKSILEGYFKVGFKA